MIHHVTRATRHLIFWSLIFAAIGLSVVRVLLLGVDRYKGDLAGRIAELVGSPVRLEGIGANMRGVSPELVLKNIDIDTAKWSGKPAIHLDEIRIGLNLGDLVLKRDILASSWITLVGAHLSVYRDNFGNFAVEGLDSGAGQPLWLLQGRQYKLLQSQIRFNDYYKNIEPFKLDDVNVAIINEGNHHRINLIAQLPQEYGNSFKAAADFYGQAEKISELKGRVFFEGSRVKFPYEPSGYLPFDISVNGGSADFKVWCVVREEKPVSIKGDVQLHQTGFSRPNREGLSIKNLDTQFHWRNKNNQWELDLNRFLLESVEGDSKSTKKWPDVVASIANEEDKVAGRNKVKLYAKQTDIAELSKLALFLAPLSDAQKKLLKQMNAKGMVKNLALYLEPDTHQFAVGSLFDSIGIDPSFFESGISVPGLTNLSGRLLGSDKLGALQLESRNVRLKADNLFETPLLFNRLNGLIDWRQTDSDWQLSSPSIHLGNSVLNTESRFEFDIPKNEDKPFIDLQMSVNSENMQEIAGYLPVKIMKDRLKQWLSGAFVNGKASNGGILVYGQLADFPFKDGSGVLEAGFDLKGVELNFNPNWPHISGIGGRLTFENSAIKGEFKQGKIGNVQITQAEALIADLGSNQEQLVIKGSAQGDINAVLSVLNQSPIASRVSTFSTGVTITGSTKSSLEMTVPFWPNQEMKLDGNAQLNNSELTVNKLGIKVKKLIGVLKYNMKGIYSDGLQGHALGNPIRLKIDPAEYGTWINVYGKTSVHDIEKLFDWSDSQIASGGGDYQLTLQVPKAEAGNQPVHVDIQSTLEGVDLTLPGALAKTGQQKKPSSLSFVFGDASAMPIELNYNNELKAAISYDSIQHKVNSGHILVGSGSVLQRRTPGLKFEINKNPLPLQDWLALAASQQQLDASGFDLDEIKIQSESAVWKKTRLGPFELTMTRKPDYWVGETDSSIAKGNFQIPASMQGSNPIVMDMEMLNLSALKQFKSQSVQTSDSNFKPILNIRSKKNLWQTANLGKLVLITARTQQGVAVKRLELDGSDQKLVAEGDWKDNGVTSATQLKGKLDLKKADQLFDKLNITKDLTETSGAIDFDLNWRDAPWQLSASELRGQLDVNLENGRILSIEPGFGRLLGILAVEQWLRRLQFDFSDIFEEGLTFNSIKGHFELANGKAVTNNLVIDAVPAMITITGETDLTKQTIDHVIKVVPKSSSAVPIAGTIVGKLAALVGKSLTGKDQEGFFFGTQYRVKGSWDDAKISSLHENDGIFQKTWNSITDFSWLKQNSGTQKNNKKEAVNE